MMNSHERHPEDGAPIGPSEAGPPSAERRAGTARLSTAECWGLLENARLGRLAVSDDRGAPDIFPVNFVAFEGAIYLRTARGTKFSRIIARPAAALEIDGEDDDTRWSVVVRGSAHQVRSEAEFRVSGAAGLVPWSPGAKPFAIKLVPESVSGRRFAKSASETTEGHQSSGAGDPDVQPVGGPEAPGDDSPHAARDDANGIAKRAHPPDPIPHHPPLPDGPR